MYNPRYTCLLPQIMPPQTEKLSKNLQKAFVRHLLFEFERDKHKFILSNNAEEIAQIDPDLSLTAGLIAERIETSGGRGCAPYYERLLTVGLYCVTRNFPNERDQKNPTKRTDQDLRALQNIDMILNSPLRVPFIPRERENIDDWTLAMFGHITAWRPDLTARPEFPWNTAVHLALSRPATTWVSKYYERVNILTKAPEGVLNKPMAEHANAGRNILETLYYEKPFGKSGIMPEESPKLWEVIRRAPDGNLPLARSTFLWTLRVQRRAIYRAQEQYGKPITKNALDQTWQLAQKKWNALSAEDKGKYMNIDVLIESESLYRYSREHGKKPPPQMDQMLQTIVQTTSGAGKKELKQYLIAYVKRYPKANLDIIAEWFPTIAGAAEAHRPKTLFQKAATLFHRS
jgi:hypothetical protein